MQEIKKAVGRPAIRIQPAVLSKLREDAGLTQFDLAKAVYALAGKRWESKGSLKSTVQRWEARGTLNKALVPHLAAVLKTTVEVLTGVHPLPAPSRLEELENILQLRAQDPTQLKLHQALKEIRDSGLDADASMTELATDLNQLIEAAQLSQSAEDFCQISEMTGLGPIELQRSTSHHGFWLVIGLGQGLAFREIISGIESVLFKLEEEWKEIAQTLDQADSRIEFSEEKPWFKVSWTAAHIPTWNPTVRFVRCQPNAKGLHWVSPSDWDRFQLKSLTRRARPYFDAIKGFNEIQIPSNWRNLRIQLQKNHTNRSSEALILHAGRLAEQSDELIKIDPNSFEMSFIAMHHLCFGLWEKIKPFLTEWPLKYWSIKASSSHINILLNDIPMREWPAPSAMPPFGYRFNLSLVELQADESYREAPWKTSLVELVTKRLNHSLQEARS